MKITISPTNPPLPGMSNTSISHAVSIEHPHDDLDMEALLPLIRAAVLAYGFHPDSVKDYLGE